MAAHGSGTLAAALVELGALGIRVRPEAASASISGMGARVTSITLLERLCQTSLSSWAAADSPKLPAAVASATRLNASLSVPVMVEVLSATDVSVPQLVTPKLLETSDFAVDENDAVDGPNDSHQEAGPRCLKMRLQDCSGTQCAAIE